MDMFLILLIFSLVPRNYQPEGDCVLTPKISVESGVVNTILQLKNDGSFIWIDSSCVDKSETEIMSSTLSRDALRERIKNLKRVLKEKGISEYYFLIRCPNSLRYSDVKSIVDMIYGNKGDSAGLGANIIPSVIGSSDDLLHFARGAEDGKRYLEVIF
jgi:biopolymer transport protein ExbD